MKKTALLATFLLVSCSLSASISESESVSSSPEESSSAAIEPPTYQVMSWNVYLGKGDMGKMADVMEENRPDIINLQECTDPCKRMLQDVLNRVEEYVLVCDKIGNMTCATPIIFDSSKFDYIDSGTEMLEDIYEGVKTKSLSYLVLEEKETGNGLIHLNFHGAVCTPNYDGYEQYTSEECSSIAMTWKEGNVLQLMNKAQELKKQYGDYPVEFSGDCNFDENSTPYQNVISSGYFDAEKVATEERTQDGLKSNHPLAGECKEGKTIDHIFADKKLTFLKHHIERGHDALVASDHCPVLATILMEEAPYA